MCPCSSGVVPLLIWGEFSMTLTFVSSLCFKGLNVYFRLKVCVYGLRRNLILNEKSLWF